MRGRGRFVVSGAATLEGDSNNPRITLVDDAEPARRWEFGVYAPHLLAGVAYEGATDFVYDQDSSKPHMGIGVPQYSCSHSTGTFQVQQQGQRLVMQLAYSCVDNGVTTVPLEAVVTFTPLSAMTPTPTALPANLFRPEAAMGYAELEYTSAPGDPLGGGVGQRRISGVSALKVVQGLVNVTLTVEDSQDSTTWGFNFGSQGLVVGQPYRIVP